MAAVKPGPQPRRVVALVGELGQGPARHDDELAELRVFGSASEAGVGELRRLVASLRRGGIDEIWILLCRVGHSEARAIKQACRKRCIPVRLYDGRGQARRGR